MNTGSGTNIAGKAADGIHLPHFSSVDMEQHKIFAEVLDALEKGRLNLPTLPDMATKFQSLIDNPDASENQMVDLLSTDPVVSMYIIRAANSAALSGGNPVGNLRDAISRLGYRLLRSMVMNIVMTRLYYASSPLINRLLVKLWRHSREVAASCYVLAQQQKHLKPEDAMLAGLVHDIGALPLYIYADRRRSEFDQKTLEELVQKFAPAVGTKLLQSWGFPDELVAVAAGHGDLYRENNSGVADYVDVVTMANMQTPRNAISVAWKNVLAAERLGYYAADCRNFLLNHAEQLAATKDMLGINTRY